MEDTTVRQRKPESEPKPEEDAKAVAKKRKRARKPPTVVDRTCSLFKFITYTVLFGALFLAAVLLIVLALPDKINAVPFIAKRPRPFTGALAPNTRLQDVEKLFEGQVVGAESFAMQNGVIYSGTHDGRIIKIKDGKLSNFTRLSTITECGTYESEQICGRPLGMKFEGKNSLLIADAYMGVFRVNVETGEIIHLVRYDRSAKGKYFKFFNDILIVDKNTIFFTDSSSKWQRRQFGYIALENDNCGRVSWYNEKTNMLDSFVNQAHFPNGLALSPDGEYILFCETTRYRVLKYYLKGEKAGQIETFIDNLPGFPDNISPSSSGGFWIGLAFAGARVGSVPAFDFLYQHPWIRNMIAKVMNPGLFISFLPKYGLIVEVNVKGEIIQSLHDPSGKVISSVSEVLDTGNELYLGTFGGSFIGRLNLRNQKQ